MTGPVPPINLAVNYSPQAAALVRAARIAVDYLKCPNWPDLIADASALGPIYVHFNFELGDGSAERVDWDAAAQVLEATGTRYVNVHVAPRQKDFPDMAVDSAAAPDMIRLRDRLLVELEPIAARFGAARVIVENAPYRGEAGSFPRPAIMPEVFAGLVDRVGCGLVLDLGHAAITARALQMDVRDYLEAMPARHLVELHASGVRHDGTRWRDHMGMTDEDWALLDWALDRSAQGRWARPWMLAYEYGGVGPVFEWRSDVAVLAADVPRFRAATTS